MIDIDQMSKDVSLLAKSISVKIDPAYAASQQQLIMTSEHQIKTELALFLLDTNTDYDYETRIKCLEVVIKNLVLEKDPSINVLEQIIIATEKNLSVFVQSNELTEQQKDEQDSQNIILSVIAGDLVHTKRDFLKNLIEIDEKDFQYFVIFAVSSCSQQGIKDPLFSSSLSLPGFLNFTFKRFWDSMLADDKLDGYHEKREKFKNECVYWTSQVHWDRTKPGADERREFEEKIKDGFDQCFKKSEAVIESFINDHLNPLAISTQNILKNRSLSEKTKQGPSI